MFRIDHATSVAVMPAPLAAGAGGYFSRPSPGGDVPTVVTTDWCNAVQEEIVGVILGAGLALNKADNGQLLEAIQSLTDAGGIVGAGAIFGLTTSNNAANPTTRIDIAAGLTRDSSNTAKITLGAPITKRLDAAWAVGTDAGGRDTGGLANGQTWHVFVILNPATGVVDALFSRSPTAPTLPVGFTKFRRIGAVILDAAATTIRKYKQNGDWFELETRSTDFAAQANGGGVPYLRTVSVPDGIVVEVLFYFQSLGTADANPYLSGLFNAAHGVPAAFGGASQWAQIRRQAFAHFSGGYVSYGTVMARAFSNTSRQIYTFSSDNAADVIALGVVAWRDERGKFF